MASRWSKSLLVAAFSLVSLFFFNMSEAQSAPADSAQASHPNAESFDPSKVILEHIGDGHEFHFWTFKSKPATIPLPVILYSPQRGWSFFMFSHFRHGEGPMTNTGC